jgi:hypothetical protein
MKFITNNQIKSNTKKGLKSAGMGKILKEFLEI